MSAGYVTTISPQLSGYVAEVPVRDYEEVKAGQLLVRIDDRITVQSLRRQKQRLRHNGRHWPTRSNRSYRQRPESPRARPSSTGPKRLWQRREQPGPHSSARRQRCRERSDADQARAAFEQADAGVKQADRKSRGFAPVAATTLGARAGLEGAVAGARRPWNSPRSDLDNTRIVRRVPAGWRNRCPCRAICHRRHTAALGGAARRLDRRNFKETQLDGCGLVSPSPFR